jgi:hypothetical protein
MGHHYKTTPEQRTEIVRRYNAGENLKYIAHDFGITGPMVGLYARAAGAARRRSPPRLKKGGSYGTEKERGRDAE